MSDIKDWAVSAGGNTSTSPNGFPEGMAPSGVNDSARELMAAVARDVRISNPYRTATATTTTNISYMVDNPDISIGGVYQGMIVGCLAPVANTGTANLQIAGVAGSKFPLKYGGAHLQPSAVAVNQPIIAAYNAPRGSWDMVNPTVQATTTTSGYRVLIQSQSPSGASSADFTTGIDTSIYQSFIIETYDLNGSGGSSVQLYFRVSTDGGSTFKSGASDYAWQFNASFSSSSSTPQSSGSSGGSEVVLGSVYTGSLMFLRSQIYIGSSRTKVNYDSNYVFSTGTAQASLQGSGLAAFGSVNAFRLIPASGTITGTVNLYGITK